MKDKMEDIRMVTFITTVLAVIITLLIKFGLLALIVWGICMCFGLSFIMGFRHLFSDLRY